MSSSPYTPVLQKLYNEQVIAELIKSRGYKNKHQVPKITKVTLNTGIDAEADKNQIADIVRDLGSIAGQKPVTAKSKKAISNFKLRQGQIVGAHVTLRGNSMWEFLYRLLAVALPTIRDFRGVGSKQFDGRGTYSLGVPDQTIFPEIELDKIKRQQGMDITIVTSAPTNEEAYDLLKMMGMPFSK